MWKTLLDPNFVLNKFKIQYPNGTFSSALKPRFTCQEEYIKI